MRKVLFLTNTNDVGGAEISILELLSNLDRSRFHPLVAISPKGPFFQRIKQLNIDTLPIDFYPEHRKSFNAIKITIPYLHMMNIFSYIFYIFRILRVIHRMNIDIVHSNFINHHIFVCPVLRIFSKARILCHIREMWFFGSRRFRLVQWILKTFYTDLIAISESISSHFTDREIREKISVIYNGVSIQKSEESIDLIRDKLDIPNGFLVVFGAGRLVPWKGFNILIKALSRAQNNKKLSKPLFLGIFGNDTLGKHGYKWYIEDLAKNLGVNNCKFYDFQEDFLKILECCDVFVHSSIKPEPFGRVIIEAMSKKRIVIASNDGGVPEIIDHGIDGFLFEPGNYTELSDMIVTVLSMSSEEKEKISSAALNKVVNKFTSQKYASQVMDIYDRLLSDH